MFVVKFFDGITNKEDLKKAYRALMKDNHPDTKPEDERDAYSKICQDITDQYTSLYIILPSADDLGLDKKVKYGWGEAYRVFRDIRQGLDKLPIYRKYYKKNFYESYPDDDPGVVQKGVSEYEDGILDANEWYISKLETICFNKLHLSLDEVNTLYELCGRNAEKFKRVIAFFSTLAIASYDIHANLAGDNPVPFFDDEIPLEGIPDYSSSLVFNSIDNPNLWKKYMDDYTWRSFATFCGLQRDSFERRHISKLTETPRIERR